MWLRVVQFEAHCEVLGRSALLVEDVEVMPHEKVPLPVPLIDDGITIRHRLEGIDVVSDLVDERAVDITKVSGVARQPQHPGLLIVALQIPLQIGKIDLFQPFRIADREL